MPSACKMWSYGHQPIQRCFRHHSSHSFGASSSTPAAKPLLNLGFSTTNSSTIGQALAGMQTRHRHLIALSASSTPGSGSPSSNQQLVHQPSFSTPGAGIGKNATVKDIEAAIQNAGDSNNNNAGGDNKDWLPLVAVAAIGIVICYADRSNMSTAILPMAKAYNWDKAYEGVILSAFFAGYAATQVLGGSLADRYGGKFVLTAGVFLWSVFTVVTPGAAAAGTVPLLAARVLLGVGEGVAFPSIHSIIARNVPSEKRSTAVGIVTAASYAGTALAFGVSPLLISKFGWQWVFYLFGGSALLWLPFWLPLNVARQLSNDSVDSRSASWEPTAASSKEPASWFPAQQQQQRQELPPRTPLSIEEVQPLLPSAGGETSGTDFRQQVQQQAAGTPTAAEADPPLALLASSSSSNNNSNSNTGFWALMRRREVWAICACQYAQSYGMYGLLTWLPTFFSEYYQVEVGDLGGYTLLPYLLQGIVGAGAGAVADQLLTTGGWSVRSVRVGLQLAGMLGPAVCLMAAVSPAVGGSAEAAAALVTVGLGFSALTLGAVSVNHLDIAPRHAGVIFGAGNTAATLAGLVSVPLTGWVLQKTASWPLVFGLIGLHFVVGSAVWAAWVGDKPLPEDGTEDVSRANTQAA